MDTTQSDSTKVTASHKAESICPETAEMSNEQKQELFLAFLDAHYNS
jgi:hypothetical protein